MSSRADINAYKPCKKESDDNQTSEIKAKLKLAKNIALACQSASKNNEIRTEFESRVDQWAFFTKTPKAYLDKIHIVERHRSLFRAIAETEPIPIYAKHYIYNDIRDVFVTYFVEKLQLPSNITFMKTLTEKRSNAYYKNLTLRHLVKNRLVEYHYEPSLKKNILSENPAFAYQRNIYLRQLIKLRSSRKDFIYVTVKEIENKKDKSSSYLALAVSPTTGIIGKCDAIHSHVSETIHNIRQWISCHILRQIPEGSVVVLTQPRKTDFCEPTLTPYSSREEMMEWLEQRNVPYDHTDHKATLYNLVKFNKRIKKDGGFYEDIFKSAGFEVAVTPIEYERLDFFGSLYDILREQRVNTKLAFKFLFDAITAYLPNKWMLMEENILVEERKVMKQDNDMLIIIDSLIQIVNNGNVTQENFPKGPITTKADYFDAHIGDIIVD